LEARVTEEQRNKDARVALGLAIEDLTRAVRELAAAGKVVSESKLFSEEVADVLARARVAQDAIPSPER
jgi:hypothetical protein